MEALISLSLVLGVQDTQTQATAWVEWVLANKGNLLALAIFAIMAAERIKAALAHKDTKDGLDIVGYSIEHAKTPAGKDYIKHDVSDRMENAKAGVRDAIKKMVDRVDSKKGG